RSVAHRHRAPQPAPGRERSRPLCPYRSLVRRPVRAHVRRTLPGGGHGHGTRRFVPPRPVGLRPSEFRASAQPSAPMGVAYRAAQRLGVARLTNMFPAPPDCGHLAPYCAEEKAYRDARFMDAYVAETGAPERDAQVRATPGLDGRPLVVLSASDHSDQGLPPPT